MMTGKLDDKLEDKASIKFTNYAINNTTWGSALYSSCLTSLQSLTSRFFSNIFNTSLEVIFHLFLQKTEPY